MDVDNVEAATSVYEYLGEARVGDDGIDDERVDPRIRDVVRMVSTVEHDGCFGPVEEEGGCELHGEDLLTLALLLARAEARRGSLVDHKTVVDLGKPLVLVAILFLGVLLLVVFLDAQAFEVFPKHVAVLEVVVCGPLVVGTRFLDHLVEDTPAGGGSRLLAVHNDDKVICRGSVFALLVLLLLPVVPFGAPVGALGFLILALPFVLVTTKDGTNRLLAGGVVGDDVHQLIGGGGGVVAQLSNQLLASGSREKSHDDVGVGDVRKLGALFGETPNIVTEGLAQLLFIAPKVPRVTRVHIGHLEVSLKYPLQVVLVMDLSRWEVLEPCSSGV
jgi:hypothetical protein